MTNVILYGIAGVEDNYRIVKYFRFLNEVRIADMVLNARLMAEYSPFVKEVYAIDCSSELYWDYQKTIKNKSFEANISFRDNMNTNGIRLL